MIAKEAKDAKLRRASRCRPAMLPASRSRRATSRGVSRSTCGSTRSRRPVATRTRRWAASPPSRTRRRPSSRSAADQQRQVGRAGERPAGRQRPPQPLGDRDRADDRAQHELHGRPALDLRPGHGYRPPSLRDRLRSARRRRRASQPRARRSRSSGHASRGAAAGRTFRPSDPTPTGTAGRHRRPAVSVRRPEGKLVDRHTRLTSTEITEDVILRDGLTLRLRPPLS